MIQLSKTATARIAPVLDAHASYVAMVVAGLLVELAFMAVGLVPRERAAEVVEPRISLNYTTVLNVLFLAFGVVLLVRFPRWTRENRPVVDGSNPASERPPHARVLYCGSA